jgi:HSP20 family protein
MITGKMLNFPYWGWNNPQEEMTRMRQEMNRLFGDTMAFSSQYQAAGVFPLVNIYEDHDVYTIRAELPGLTSENLEITAKGKSLVISGERKISPKGENARFHRRERQAGTFSRTIALPVDLEVGKIEAHMKDGILTIQAPKAEAAKPKSIKIN